MKYKIYIIFFYFFFSEIYGQSNQWFAFPAGVPELANRYITIDNNDTKWVGGYGAGLHKFTNGNWKHYTTSNSGISNNDVRQACFDTLGNLWVATWQHISKLDTSTNVWTTYTVSPLFDILYSIEVDSKNRVWVGTDGGSNPSDGLYMFNGTSWKFYNPGNSSLTGKWILDLKKDKIGKIWGGHSGGLFEINDTTITNHSLAAAGFSINATATCVDFDSYNNKWVSIYNGGIAKFNGVNWTIYTPTNSPLPENKIWSIAVDKNNVVWIGTETKGLVKFDGTNWTIYDTSNSIISSTARIDALSVDQLNNLWISNSYGANSIIIYNSNGVMGVSGTVYFDLNNNSIKDLNENIIPNCVIEVTPGGYYAITDNLGNYYCPILNPGTFSVKATSVLNSYQIGTNPSNISINVSPSSTYLNNKNFGIIMTPNIHDISVDMTPINPPRPGFNYGYNITAKNIGSTRSDSIFIKMAHDPILTLSSTSVPYLNYQNDTLTWLLDSISLLNTFNVKIFFTIPSVTNLGKKLPATVVIKDKYTDIDTSNNSSFYLDTVVGAFDPNDKTPFPKGDGAAGNIEKSSNYIIYTIRFQNTGTDTAFNIVLKDTISDNLDFSSLRIISSSHKYSTEISNGRTILWHFKNILLPDSNTNEKNSHGYIKYKINLKHGLQVGEQIKNTCYIYFDFNLPIITNTALNTIIDNPQIPYLFYEKVTLYPNPSNNLLSIDFDDTENEIQEITISNLLGQKVFVSNSVSSRPFEISLTNYLNGLYFLKVFFKDNTTSVIKFIKLSE